MITVVTGASGHLGGNLVRVLLERGHEVRALVHRDTRSLEGLPAEIVHGDVTDPASLVRAFAGAEIVYHTAALISLSLDEWPLVRAVNIEGTRNVIEACLECGVRRLVHVSSIHALRREPLDLPVDESRPLIDSSQSPPYDLSKAEAERLVRAAGGGLETVVLYPTGIVGPYDFRPSFFGRALLSLAKGKLPALVAGGFDWVDVRDVAGGVLRAGEAAPPGSGYLLSGRWASLVELAAMIGDLTGVRPPRLVCPLGIARFGAPLAEAAAALLHREALYTRFSLQALQGNHRVSHAKAQKELDYRPRELMETLSETLAWFVETGVLRDLPGSVKSLAGCEGISERGPV